ncbi:MAG TPA: hypothetical protein VIF09_28775, partial [Polyangiaceae bacterium]
KRGKFYAILPMLPEVCGDRPVGESLKGEYSSEGNVMTPGELEACLRERRLMVEDAEAGGAELLA